MILSGLALLLVESPVWLRLMGDTDGGGGGDPAGSRQRASAAARGRPPARDPRLDGLSTVFSLAGRGAIFIGIGCLSCTVLVWHQRRDRSTRQRNSIRWPTRHGNSAWRRRRPSRHRCGQRTAPIRRRRPRLTPPDAVHHPPAAPPGSAPRRDHGGGLSARHSTSTGDIPSVTGLYLFIVAFSIGLGPIAWVAAAELLPSVRGIAMGMVVASHRLFHALAAPGPVVGRSARPLRAAGGSCACDRRVRRVPPALSRARIDRWRRSIATSPPGLHGQTTRFAHYAGGVLGSLSGMPAGYNLAITAVTLVLITDDWELDGFAQAPGQCRGGGRSGGGVCRGPLSDRFVVAMS